MTLNATHAQRQLALRSMQAVCVCMIFGSGYGLFVAGPAGLLSTFEWVTVPLAFLTGLALLAALYWLGTDWLERIGLGLSAWLGLYVLGNIANALFIAATTDNLLVYLGWVIPLYLFYMAVNQRRRAMVLIIGSAAIIVAMLAAYILVLGSPDSAFTGALVSWAVAQLSGAVLIIGVSSFRELYAAEAAAMATLAEGNSRITALAEQLASSEARARRLIELAPDVPGLVDAAGRLIEIGPNCRTIWGLERDARIGRPLASLFTAEDQPVVTARLEAARAGAASGMQPGRIRHADGYEQPVQWSVAWSAADAQYFIWAQAAE